jgi:predicted secreted protein
MSDIVTGRNWLVQGSTNDGLSYKTIGCAYSGSIELENELIGKTDRNAGLFRKKRVRMTDCRVTVQGIMTLNNDADKLSVMHYAQEAIRRTEQYIRCLFTDEAGVDRYIAGLFLVRLINLTGEIAGFGEFDMSLEGTGGIVIEDLEEPPIPGVPEDFSDWWDGAEGETTIAGAGTFGRSFAGDTILAVARETSIYYETSGTPGPGEFSFDGTTISFNTDQPFNPGGERVFVMWKES